MAVLSWTETWTASDGSPWPSGWDTAGVGAVTVQSGAGRLQAGPGSYASVRGRFDRMTDQRDTDILLTFIPRVGGEWYLNIGTRTQSNDPALNSDAVTQRGMYATINNLLGQSASFTRWNDTGASTVVASVATGLPVFAIGTAYKLRFRILETRLYLRVWAAASPEPGGWNLRFIDRDAFLAAGKVTVGFTTNASGTVGHIDLEDLTVTALNAAPDSSPWDGPGHAWTMWSRTPGYATDRHLPISSATMVLRWLGVDKAVITTPYSEAAWLSLQPSCGVVLYRDGRQKFTGLVGPLELDWDAGNGRLVIKAECYSDLQHLADRPVFPDPLRAADDQTVNDYWTHTGAASSAMIRLISDQAGPTAHVDRRVPGLALGADPGVGLSRTWTGLFSPFVLEQLALMSIASGEDLGLRTTTEAGSLTFDVIQPRDLSDSVKFSVEFGNVAGIRYRLEPPKATHALSAGQGDLHLRLRKLAVTASSLALSWGRQVWSYIDRRDTADVAELQKANDDALADGDATVSLAATLLDSQAATYGRDWDLGDAVTVYVRVPGQDGPVATVADVVREIEITVDSTGAETIRPAIGSHGAKASTPTATQQQLARVALSLAGLEARK